MFLTLRQTLVGATILFAYHLYEPIPRDVEDFYHIWRTSKIVSACRLWYRITGRKNWEFDPIQTFATYAPPDEAVKIRDDVLDGVEVRYYDAVPPEHPRDSSIIPDPIVLWIHGGGFAWGSVKATDRLVQRMAKRSRLLWASVEYRRSPTHAFPAAHEDVLAVARKLLERHRFQTLIVIGASCGGNMGAFLSQALRPENPEEWHPVVAQVLIYPALQGFDVDTPSYHLPYAPIMSPEDVQYFTTLFLAGNDAFTHTRLCTLDDDDDDDDPLRLERYFNLTDPRLVPAHLPPRDFDRHRSPRLMTRRERLKELDPKVVAEDPKLKQITKFCEDPRLSPLLADDVSRLPPTYIQSCEYDLLRDDAFFYAARLLDNGVDVKHDMEEKTYHGIFTNLDSPRGGDMREKAVLFIVHHVEIFREKKHSYFGFRASESEG